jgi:hypothetical protein
MFSYKNIELVLAHQNRNSIYYFVEKDFHRLKKIFETKGMNTSSSSEHDSDEFDEFKGADFDKQQLQ